MCGISGIYSKDENLELILNKFNQTLKNRGPDYASIYLDKKIFWHGPHSTVNIRFD